MSLDNPKLWLNSSAEYLISGIPWVTGSTIALGDSTVVNFPKVTRAFTVRCTSGSVAVGFSANGLLPANSNFFVLNIGESYTGDLRVRRLFVSGAAPSTYEIIAGLTRIDASALMGTNEISGSSGFEGVG